MNISQWSEEDRPREKLLLKGRHNLSDAELLALILRSGSKNQTAVDLAREVLSSVEFNLDVLAKKGVEDFTDFCGIGLAKSVALVAAFELGRRRKIDLGSKKKRIQSSDDAFDTMKSKFMDLDHEQFWILLLNRSNEVLSQLCISKGGVSGTVVDARLIFKPAIAQLASGVILFHNHPSGNLKPSEADTRLTKKLIQAGKNLDIQILDHLIVSQNKYLSFRDEGLL